MPEAWILGVNTQRKFIRVLTMDHQEMDVHVQPSDLAALKWLLEVMDSGDDC